MKTEYIANDGTRFSTKAECRAHDRATDNNMTGSEFVGLSEKTMDDVCNLEEHALPLILKFERFADRLREKRKEHGVYWKQGGRGRGQRREDTTHAQHHAA